MPEPARILLYALLAAASPVTLLATLVVLGTGRARVNGLAFAIAFLLGQALAFIVVFFLGLVVGQEQHSTASAWVELVAGAGLLFIALRGRPPHLALEPDSAPRTEALFARLSRVTPGLAFGFGFPLGIGVKRLAITILAAATITLSNVSVAEEMGLSMLYFVVGTTVVWVPVALYLVFGSRADDAVARSRSWIANHEQALAFYSALALGVLFVLDGLIQLLT